MTKTVHIPFELKEFKQPPKILIVRSAYRKDIIDNLAKGVEEAFEEYNVASESIEVHGSLEIPGAIALAQGSKKYNFDGYVGLGCVLKGETIHDEVIAYAAYNALQKMVIEQGLAIGCGILTVNTEAQAQERADPARQNRGREAALATLQMIALKSVFEV